MAATTCIHGFAPGQCLICQTLEGGKAPVGKERGAKQQDRPRGVASRPTPVRPDLVVTDRPSPGPSLAWRAGGMIVLIALVVLAGVWIVGLAFTVLRTIELAATALVAAWLGYRIGLYRGRHAGPGR